MTDIIDGTPTRGRGGYLRSGGRDGTPMIPAADGTTTKSGPNKGQPRRNRYGSPSNFGKLIENTTNLQKWGERRIALGIGTQLALIADCARLTLLDDTTDEYRTLADSIVTEAKRAAKAFLAADRGTHTHAILEDDDEGRDWLQRAEAGENLGIGIEAQTALVDAWRGMLERNGLEILVTEHACVDDRWRLAGTLDNLARLSRPLIFDMAGGRTVTIDADTVIVLDKKTGQLKRNAAGIPQYWHGYVTQVASYAQSVPYNVDTETRSEWPWAISQDHAIIAHLDVEAAIAGAAADTLCTLIYVDIGVGRDLGGATVLAAKQWGSHQGLCSIAQRHDTPVLDDDKVRVWLEQRIDTLRGIDGGITALSARWPEDVPTFKQSDAHTVDQLGLITTAIAAAEQAVRAPFPDEHPDTPPPPQFRMEAPDRPVYVDTKPDEGEFVDPETMTVLRNKIKDNNNGLLQRAEQWSREARDAGCTINLKYLSQRRLHIGRIILATVDTDLDVITAYAATVTGYQTDPAEPFGALLGRLTHTDAADIMTMIDTANPVTFTDAGQMFAMPIKPGH